jgi:hypothetical protein
MLIGPGISAALASPGALAAARLPVLYDCAGWHDGQTRDSVISLSCDPGVLVRAAGWKYWTGVSARSRDAKLWVDNCTPDCVRGHYRKYPATVILYRVRCHYGVRYYSRLKLMYRHDRRRTYVYRWAKYPGATIPVWIGGP